MKNFEDLVKKVPNLAGQGASSNPKRNWQQGPTCKRGKTLEDSGKGGRGLGRSGPRPVSPGRSAQPTSMPSRLPLWPSRLWGYLLPPEREPHINSFVIRRRGVERLEGHHLGDEGHASCVGSS
jgi:hypothetical protein